MVLKDKNFVIITTGKEKVYRLDINTGCLYGASQRPLKHYPAGFKVAIRDDYYNTNNHTWLGNLLYLLCETDNRRYVKHENQNKYDWNVDCEFWTEFADLLTTADKIDAINYPIPHSRRCAVAINADEMRFVGKYFKDFAKFCRETENNCTLNDFYKKYQRIIWERENAKILRNLNESNINVIYYCITNYNIPDDMLELFAYYFTHGVAEFYDIPLDNFAERYNPYHGQISSAIDRIKSTITKAKDLDYKLTKDNYFTQAIAVNKMYKIHKQKIDTKKIKEAYEPHLKALTFRSDEFFVKIPQTEHDFVEEANGQNNCVHSYYFPKVVDKKTYVVFIRRIDNPDKTYVTCEIDLNGRINQYLRANNQYVADDFQNVFQAFLKANW